MNAKKNYSKKYKLISQNNNYLICFESLDINNEKKININLTHNLSDKKINFYTQKTLEQIHNQYTFLIEYNTTKSLIDYFAKLTKLDSITIEKKNKLIYNLIFYDANKNQTIQLSLKRKIDLNENNIGEIEEEILNMYNNYENLENNIKLQDQKIAQLKQEYDKRIKTLESIISENISIKSGSNNNPIAPNKEEVEELSNSLEKGKCVDISIYSESSYGFRSHNNFNENRSINNSIHKEENIFKENNNTILFGDPEEYKEKIIISKENEKCEIFTAFNLPNNHTIIAWTTKNKENIIKIRFNDGNIKQKEAHKKNINCLQYFHNEYLLENNNYIISLSENDEENLIIWEITNEDDLKKFNIINLLNKKINIFCMFNNQNYAKDNNSYIFIYGEKKDINMNDSKEIICIKLNINLEIIKWDENNDNKLLHNNDKINYLDTFYSKKLQILYLINCNERDVNIYENPLGEYKNIYYINSNEEKFHLSAFIVERNNIIQLFDSNQTGINIWDINNKNEKSKINFQSFSIIYDICLWNNDYLCASTNNGLHLINIKDNKIIKTFDDKPKNFGKIRKIYISEIGHSIIGIDSNHNLCSWPIITKKN